MPKVILISQFPLPYSHIGSWTTMYRNYLESDHQIDVIICEKPAGQFPDVQYEIVKKDGFSTRLSQKLTRKKFRKYTEALDRLISPNEKYIIQVVDNFGLAKAVQKYLEEKNIRRQCYLQFFYHGFAHLSNGSQNLRFYEKTDEIILLTHSSYADFKTHSNILPSRFSILSNGVDNRRFFTLAAEEKAALKGKSEFKDKKIFIWCSQDRPKKGLHLILDAWKRIYKSHKDIALLVIGCDVKEPQEGVHYLGRIPNDDLPQYYQMADVYLFSTLCLEGFGMSLIEALHCGCYCIASALGGVPEVLQHGKLGKLIENPHFINDWVLAMEEFLSDSGAKYAILAGLYTSENWNRDMNTIINEAKLNL